MSPKIQIISHFGRHILMLKLRWEAQNQLLEAWTIPSPCFLKLNKLQFNLRSNAIFDFVNYSFSTTFSTICWVYNQTNLCVYLPLPASPPPAWVIFTPALAQTELSSTAAVSFSMTHVEAACPWMGSKVLVLYYDFSEQCYIATNCVTTPSQGLAFQATKTQNVGFELSPNKCVWVPDYVTEWVEEDLEREHS